MANLVKFFIIANILIMPLHAYETDNFTMRYKKLEPSDSVLDKIVNDAFFKVVKKANDMSVGCEKAASDDVKSNLGQRKFRNLIREEIAPPGNEMGVFEKIAEGKSLADKISDRILEKFGINNEGKSKSIIPKHSIPMDQSIYGGGVNVKIILGTVGISSSINLGNNYIGTDKLGHFFDQGYEYFKRYSLNRSKTNIFDLGISDEGLSRGKVTTGISSYADLSANYSGFLFWSQVTDGDNPYFVCKNGIWKQQREFQWKDFVNESWDEAINCNKYNDPNFESAVEQNISKLEAKEGKKFHCPVDMEACERLSKLWKSEKYLSPKCYTKNGRRTRDNERSSGKAQ